MCYQGACDTIYHNISISIFDALSNGLPLVEIDEYNEDFENNFSLPTENMFAVEDGSTTWQLCDFAGYNSDHCIYAPAETVAMNDTSILVLGNFDLTAMTDPTFKFKVAVTKHNQVNWFTMQLLFRDLCSTTFVGNIWAQWDLIQMSGDNLTANFIPTEDAQWQHLSTTMNVWNMAGSAEFALRLIKSPGMPDVTPEAFYLDDIQIGEAAVLGVNTATLNEVEINIYPNPADDFATIRLNGLGESYTMRITDMTGRLMLEEKSNRNTIGIHTHEWPAGVYVISISTLKGTINKKLVVR